MNINDLTIGQAKELSSIFSNGPQISNSSLNRMIGEKVIIRTYSAGVWFGELSEKSGAEVILKDARRMWKWWAAESISLSGCAKYGITRAESRIAPSVDSVWLEAIEIIPCTSVAIDSIGGAEDAKS